MQLRTAQRIWKDKAGCGFCLRAEPGGVWCRGLCRTVPILELAHRISVVRKNPVRLELVDHVPATLKRDTPHCVPDIPTDRLGKARVNRSVAVERMVSSAQRLQRSKAAAELSSQRLEATERALAETRRFLGEQRTKDDG